MLFRIFLFLLNPHNSKTKEQITVPPGPETHRIHHTYTKFITRSFKYQNYIIGNMNITSTKVHHHPFLPNPTSYLKLPGEYSK
jgi:hypothetical protein